MRSDTTMKRTFLSSLVLGPALLLAALLLPGAAAAAGPITSTACTAVGTSVTCNLWAEAGSLPLPGASVPVWGFATASGGSPTVPGPVLVANEGDSVTVILVNHLSQPTSIEFGGQAMAPDLTGAAGGGGTASYTFTAGAAGTYLYEAGLIPGSQYQVAMGMYGVLVVRPAGASGQAYPDASSAFDGEALVVLGEVDPSLNNSPAPWTVDLRYFAPKYSLINGAAYPSAASIDASSGTKLLLRYANAGIQHHSIGVLGLRQSVLAADGSPIPYPRDMVAETIAPGQTADVLVSLPATSAPSTRYALYDASMTLNNSTASGIGGMLAFINAMPNGSTTGDTVGPIASGVALDVTSRALTASVSDATTGGSGVTGAEYFLDSIGANGTGSAMTGTFTADPVAVSATLGTLPGGSHTVYVHGRDGAGNWGSFSSTTFGVDAAGPTTSALVLNPSRTSGSAGVAISATGDDSATGNSNVTAAEYSIDGGTAAPMTLNKVAPTVSLTATISAVTVNGLSNGAHTVAVRSQDAAGNWGTAVSATLTVDSSGPATSGVTANPNPNNGTRGFNSSNPSVRVTASFDDTASGGSTIAAGEGFIDTVGANGSGFPVTATDGVFNGVSEAGYVDIPLTTINALSSGNHTIYVHGKDSVGNWGATSTTILVIDRIPPTVSSITRTGASPTNAGSVQFTVTFSENVTGVTATNFALVSTGLTGTRSITSVTGSGSAWTVAATTGAGSGTLGLNLTSPTNIKDAAGNAMTATGLPSVGQIYTIDRAAPTFTSITLAPTTIVAGTATVNATVNGSADPVTGGVASGVAGGEYWFGTTNITAGTGTPFTGLTATIDTSTLPVGTTTVRVRIRDAAGNWSTGTGGVRTANLTVVADAIFSDGFESPTTLPGNWTSASTTTTTRLNVTAAAALAGSLGMQAQGNNTNYVQDNFTPVTATYDARFSFNPNNNASTGQDILRASSGTNNTSFGTPLFSVRYRMNAGQPQVQVQVGATVNATWVNITNNASNTVEVVWQSGGTLALYVNGAASPSQSLTAGTGSVAAVRLGSVTSGGSNALMYFDAFASKRSVSPLIGP